MGSNSFILNQMIVMGYAYDFTGNSKYLDGMQDGMSYLLGRNGLDQSYVTGMVSVHFRILMTDSGRHRQVRNSLLHLRV